MTAKGRAGELGPFRVALKRAGGPGLARVHHGRAAPLIKPTRRGRAPSAWSRPADGYQDRRAHDHLGLLQRPLELFWSGIKSNSGERVRVIVAAVVVVAVASAIAAALVGHNFYKITRRSALAPAR
jgi:hypothetical protein